MTTTSSIKATAAGLLIRGSKFIGMDVKNRAGEDLGDIEDVMIDLTAGRIAYVVLSFGGFLGLGDKFFAVPPDVFEYSAVDDSLILNVDKNSLENAPGFDKENWPDMADRTWGAGIYSYYGSNPYWEEKP
ncbi:MAG: PRC-barrel domain-containing protein [Alphaproteobacteria bacterium]|uniref:PRC-barrel domain-containing protein n=1 Tax=Candidatus Nitrobium versatile TaxID=2884831 RepID=A0A953JAQ5_9BACT|nr:PRC-barrel domain-containing protein [Candidatus Nitrobium versatile]